jgi:hypothetical protein
LRIDSKWGAPDKNLRNVGDDDAIKRRLISRRLTSSTEDVKDMAREGSSIRE